MANSPLPSLREDDLTLQVHALLADPAHAANPLRAPLAQMLACNQAHQTQLDRLIKISDGYQQVTRHRQLTLEEQYDHHLRRLEKLARISDR